VEAVATEVSVATAPFETPVASARALGRTGLVVSPLAISGANEPTIGALFRSLEAGCNLFFWEPRYRSLSTFLREAAARGQLPLVIAGTYHASEREIRKDVDSALKRLRRDHLDVFLVFWTRSDERLKGEAPRALARLKREGLVRATGFSTHDRALAERAIGGEPWDVAMIRHSAAHPGAEDSLLRRAEENGVGVLGFSATSYGRLIDETVSAADCYRYSLSQKGVSAVVSAPRWSRELVANLDVLRAPTLDAARLSELRAHGKRVREDALDFARHIRRFPMRPEDILDRELEVASCETSL
jgi:predicted aldo/keto reductase-like oxidoreductase